MPVIEIDTSILIVILTILGGVTTALIALFGRGRDRKQELGKFIDERVDTKLREAYEEIDTMTQKLYAAARVFQAVALQVPAGFVPVLNDADIEALEDTIPGPWRKQPRNRPPIPPSPVPAG